MLRIHESVRNPVSRNKQTRVGSPSHRLEEKLSCCCAVLLVDSGPAFTALLVWAPTISPLAIELSAILTGIQTEIAAPFAFAILGAAFATVPRAAFRGRDSDGRFWLLRRRGWKIMRGPRCELQWMGRGDVPIWGERIRLIERRLWGWRCHCRGSRHRSLLRRGGHKRGRRGIDWVRNNSGVLLPRLVILLREARWRLR